MCSSDLHARNLLRRIVRILEGLLNLDHDLRKDRQIHGPGRQPVGQAAQEFEGWEVCNCHTDKLSWDRYEFLVRASITCKCWPQSSRVSEWDGRQWAAAARAAAVNWRCSTLAHLYCYWR